MPRRAASIPDGVFSLSNYFNRSVVAQFPHLAWALFAERQRKSLFPANPGLVYDYSHGLNEHQNQHTVQRLHLDTGQGAERCGNTEYDMHNDLPTYFEILNL